MSSRRTDGQTGKTRNVAMLLTRRPHDNTEHEEEEVEEDADDDNDN